MSEYRTNGTTVANIAFIIHSIFDYSILSRFSNCQKSLCVCIWIKYKISQLNQWIMDRRIQITLAWELDWWSMWKWMISRSFYHWINHITISYRTFWFQQSHLNLDVIHSDITRTILIRSSFIWLFSASMVRHAGHCLIAFFDWL